MLHCLAAPAENSLTLTATSSVIWADREFNYTCQLFGDSGEGQETIPGKVFPDSNVVLLSASPRLLGWRATGETLTTASGLVFAPKDGELARWINCFLRRGDKDKV